MAPRTVRRLHAAVRDDVRDLQTRRPLPNALVDQIDPFLFLNHHGPQVYPPGNAGLPFGPHPHRGFETVTFILDGELTHRDSAGHESVIRAGGVQWMTAGRGLVHAEVSSEDFKRRGGGLEILQLWLNLPARLKLTSPQYVGLQRDRIPEITTDGGRVKASLVSGAWGGCHGAVESLTGVTLMVLRFANGGHVRLPAEAGRNEFLYVVHGEIEVAGTVVDEHHLAEMNRDGDDVDIIARTDAVVLFGHAMPFGEPVAAYGPFVMNTYDEIDQAIREYQAGAFRGVAP
jgi:redox-sensitive bicupin YhaK (pirin superfamily)